LCFAGRVDNRREQQSADRLLCLRGCADYGRDEGRRRNDRGEPDDYRQAHGPHYTTPRKQLPISAENEPFLRDLYPGETYVRACIWTTQEAAVDIGSMNLDEVV
jgi:hypothetical protein